MFPTLFKYGSFEITTFGLMMFLAFVVGGWVLTRQFRRYGMPEDEATNVLLAAALGGIAGAKIYYAILYNDLSLMFSRAGLVWYGGLIGGTLAVTWVIWRKRLPFFRVADAVAPGLAIGYCLGRIGCFLVGDDYGKPSSLPWAVAFPEGAPPTGVPVHPTQIYEALFLAGLAWLLIRARRTGTTDSTVLGLYFVLAGGFRFLVEFIRINEPVFLGLTLAQLFALLIAGAGAALMSRGGGTSRANGVAGGL
jgi:phosphatidylglycerol:prolipoprotein diacylglycerol transferase